MNFTKLNGKTILLVEDDRLTFLFIKQVFKFVDANIVHVTNGKEAIEKIGNNHFDIVLIDIQLPDQNGKDVAKTIRNMNNQVPIIAQTASRNPDARMEAVEAGCTDFIMKPYKPTDLYAIIEKHLE